MMALTSERSLHRYALALILLLAPLPLLCGCNVVGFFGNIANGQDTVDADYKNMAGQNCGVMVWADQGVVNDFPAVQIDTANGLADKLKEAQKGGQQELKDTTWAPAEAIAQYQKTHPGLEADAIEDIAPHLNVSRLIYVEIDDFQTHPHGTPELSRGTMSATVSVVEVTNGKGKLVYNRRGIMVISPRGCPPEGLPELDDAVIYRSTIDEATTSIAKLFFQHPAEGTDYENAAQENGR